MSNLQSRDWVFTTYADHKEELLGIKSHAAYYISQLEKCPTTGREHYQGFVQFQRKMRLNDLKKFAKTTHFKRRKGTPQQAAQYCRKTDTAVGEQEEFGKMTFQGERTDLVQFVEDAKTCDKASMYGKHPSAMVRYSRAYTEVNTLFAKATRPAHLYWIFGPPGTGKSSYVKQKYPEVYIKANPYDNWWPDYSGEEVILVDEISSGLPYATLLKFGDSGKHHLPTKGGHTVSRANRVYITSNLAPDKVYVQETSSVDRWGALLRRTRFYYCDRVSVGLSRLMEMKWQDGWKPTDNTIVFPVEINNEEFPQA